MYSQAQRDEFIYYYQDIFTEDTLTLHELYLNKITKFYEENKHIFELVTTRKNLWLKMTELEARASEPGRYQNRGGQLLQEEKERKTITNKLPKIEAQIRDMVLEYEAKTDSVFTVDGKPLLQLIQDEWEVRKADNINERQISRSSMAQTRNHEANIPPVLIFETCQERNETPRSVRSNAPLTPKIGKENIQHLNLQMTPKTNLVSTPTRLTRSALKLNNDGFATPRAPLSCSKANLRQNTGNNMPLKVTPNGVARSKSHLNLMRTKNLPPIM
ncbi:jg12556 [Pararge aegeria aegeria]|uniref:Jg12556 protein n=1 Tax=Pararge aegeria aegeria TaxID=348720 RepID=A0A8S4SE21_9NEOP|nr:jg12556 [Pararge aegeria aegeria]